MAKRFRLYDSSGENLDYQFHDKISREHIYIGGTDAWVYRYMGPKDDATESDDATKPDFSILGSIESDIADQVWLENPQRNYDTNPVVLPITYHMEEPNMFLMAFGFLNQNTLQITVHYNQMIEVIGRKIMNGDVLELPHLRDIHNLDPCKRDGVNRFYEVQDTYRPSFGYSPTWYPHLYTLTVKPLQDSPEFKDILGDGSEEDDLVNNISTSELNNTIMETILAQREEEVPYMHFDNEQFYDDKSDESLEDTPISDHTNINDPHDWRESQIPEDIEEGEMFPGSPVDGQWFKRTDFTPDRIYIYYEENSQWREFDYGGRLPWVGPNQELADYINNNESLDDEPSRVPIADVLKAKPNF